MIFILIVILSNGINSGKADLGLLEPNKLINVFKYTLIQHISLTIHIIPLKQEEINLINTDLEKLNLKLFSDKDLQDNTNLRYLEAIFLTIKDQYKSLININNNIINYIDINKTDNTFSGCQIHINRPSDEFSQFYGKISIFIDRLPTNIQATDFKTETEIYKNLVKIYDNINYLTNNYLKYINNIAESVASLHRFILTPYTLLFIDSSECDYDANTEFLNIKNCIKNKSGLTCHLEVTELSLPVNYYSLIPTLIYNHKLKITDLYTNKERNAFFQLDCEDKLTNTYYHCNINEISNPCYKAIIDKKMKNILSNCNFEKEQRTFIPPIQTVNGILTQQLTNTLNITKQDPLTKKKEYFTLKAPGPYLIQSNKVIFFQYGNLTFSYSLNNKEDKILTLEFTDSDLSLLYNYLHPLENIFNWQTFTKLDTLLPILLIIFMIGIVAYLCRHKMNCTSLLNNIRKKQTRATTSSPKELTKFLRVSPNK